MDKVKGSPFISKSIYRGIFNIITQRQSKIKINTNHRNIKKMKLEIQNTIAAAGRDIAFKCHKKVIGVFDSTLADKIAESYVDAIIEIAAPCKNKMEELEYEIKQCKSAYNDVVDQKNRWIDKAIMLESEAEVMKTISIQFNNLPKWKKILKILWT